MIFVINSFLGVFIMNMKPLQGFGVSKVVDSDNPNFKPGDFISGITGWEEYSLIRTTELSRKIKPNDIPLSYHVGLLGMLILYVLYIYIYI